MIRRFENKDCIEGMKEFPDKYFDLAICDPPYGMIRKNEALMNIGNAAKKNYEMFENVRPDSNYFKELFRVSKNQIIFGGNYFTKDLSETNAWIIWDKNNGASKLSDCELAWTSFDFLTKIIRVHWVGAAALWEDTKGKIHATQKPVELYKKILQLCANEGDLIFDSHVGSASSLIACEDLGFDYIGFEIKESIFKDANQRLINYRSQPKFGFIADMNKEIINQESMF